MPRDDRADQLREASNPLFNHRKLRLGTFSTNLSGGCAISTIEGVLKADWPSTLTLATLADQMEFEALVPVGRWKGFGGETNFNGAGFELFSWAAGIGAATKHSGVFATSHVPTIYPVMAAKQATTIDHITQGRFSLNIVTGWYQPEIEMFGEPLIEHDRRYERAVEWLEIIKRLWTEEDEFDYEGKFYKITKGWLQPKPVQRPYPVIMNAGGSETGRRFAAKYCDVAFLNLGTSDLETIKVQIDTYKELAQREYGREIMVWSHAYCVQGETERDAKSFFDYYVHEKGDWLAADNLMNMLGLNSKGIPQEKLKDLQVHFVAGWGGYPLVGTKDQIVDELAKLARAGFDGVILSWARYIEEMRQFQAETLPLLQQAGLR